MADEGIKAGEAYILVSLRMAADAWTKLTAEQRGSATKAGDDLGDRIGKAIAKKIADGVKSGITAGGAGVGASGAKAGEDFGGRFAEIVKTRIEAALKSLPRADISLGTTEADGKLRDLRTRLEELSGKRIGIGISGAEALAEIDRIKAKMEELRSKSVDIRFRTDAAAVIAELEAVDAEIKKINGQNAKVDVKTNADQSTKQVNALFEAIVLLGPAAVPSAAAAVGAILGIGAAATSVFAAIGVGKLAFQGVGGALTAIDTAQQQASKSGATLAQQQNQLASGADSVKSAEASLANTRASAAASLRAANQQIGNSEQSLADAERAELRAQQDLTVARQDAKRSIEDLNTQVADGALQQRQAALDLDKARIALVAINAQGAGATADQRTQAQLTYDQAVQQVTDLSIRQQRAIQDRDAANKAGVEGSKQVKTAQEALLSANEKVGNAEQSVSNARIAAADASRQAAFSIAQAQQSVVSSQRAMHQAIVSTSVTGGAATDALRVALSKLSPEGQKFALFLYSLKPQFDELKQSAQAGLFPGLQAGITTVLPYFGQLDRFVGSVATELGHLGQEAAHTFTDPFWRQFFAFIADQAVPNLELMYRSVVNIAEGGARIIKAFGPVEQEVGKVILELSQKFAAFSQGIDHNQGLQDFIRYTETEIPHVVATVEELATAALHVIQAYAPIGSAVVSEIRLLAQVINALPIPVVTALAAAFTAYRTAALLSAGAQALVNSGIVAGTASMFGYSTATATATTAASAFRTGQANVVSFLGGPLTAALALAGTAILGLYSAEQEQKQKVTGLATSLSGLGDEYQRTGHVSAESVAQMVKANPQLAQLTDTFKAQGLTLDDLGRSYQNNAALQKRLLDAAQANADAAAKAYRDKFKQGPFSNDSTLRDAANNARDVVGALKKSYADAALYAQAYADASQTDAAKAADAFAATAKTLANASATVHDFGAAITQVGSITADVGPQKVAVFAGIADRVAASTVNATDKATLFGQILQGIGQSSTTSGATFDALNGTFESIAHSALDAHDKVNLLKQALTQAYGPARDLNAANENLATTQASLVTQIGQNSAGFDLNTALAGKNSQAIVENRKALESALLAAQDKYVQDLANNISETDARTAHDKTVVSILSGIPTRQKDTQAVKDLVKEYGDIPPYRETDIKTTGADAVLQQLQDLKIAQYALQFNVTTTEARNALAGTDSTFKSQVPAAARATGGAVFGPGTATSDSIPALLSNDEHVWTAAEVHAAGGHGQVEALRRAALEDQLPRFASGGAVTWPFEVDVTKTFLPQPPAPSSAALSTGSLGIAGTIYQVAQALKADHKVLLSAFETALVESGMRNLRIATDHDSLGVFQQRPSQGWGTPAEILDVAHSAHSYLTRAIANEPSHAKGTAGQLAQSVQRSAFPDRYDQRQAAAEATIASLTGGGAGSAVGNAISGAAGKGGAFPPWPASPAAQRGDSGVWRQVVALINSTGPISGTFGNAYRPGDPLWHGSGRAVDWMGFNQDALATFLSGQNPLELIHRSDKRDYAYTRGVNKGSFNEALMQEHRNHVHIAKKDGGAVLAERLGVPHRVFDNGGLLMPGLTLADNRTGSPELIQTPAQTSGNGPTSFNVILEASDPAVRELMSMIDVRVEAGHDRVAAAVGSGVRDY